MASITFISLFVLLVTYSYSLPVVHEHTFSTPQNVFTSSQITGVRENSVDVQPTTGSSFTKFGTVESTTHSKRFVGEIDDDDVTTQSKRAVEHFDDDVTTPSKHVVEHFDDDVTTPSKRSFGEVDDDDVTTQSKHVVKHFDDDVTTPSKRSVGEVDDDDVTTQSKHVVKHFDDDVTTPSKRSFGEVDDDDITTQSKRVVEHFDDDVTTPSKRSVGEVDDDDDDVTTPSRRSFKESDSSEEVTTPRSVHFTSSPVVDGSKSVFTQNFGRFSTPPIESSTEFNRRAINVFKQSTTFVPEQQNEVVQDIEPTSSVVSFAKSTRFINNVPSRQGGEKEVIYPMDSDDSFTTPSQEDKKKRGVKKVPQVTKVDPSTTVHP